MIQALILSRWSGAGWSRPEREPEKIIKNSAAGGSPDFARAFF
jgi:hypothetical protein